MVLKPNGKSTGGECDWISRMEHFRAKAVLLMNLGMPTLSANNDHRNNHMFKPNRLLASWVVEHLDHSPLP